MIKVEKIEKGYMTCQSCFSNENLSEIKIGFTERQTTSIRLCEKCLGELIRKSSPVDDEISKHLVR